MRTLVVDNAPDDRELIQAILTAEGQTEVLTAESAHDAFRHLALMDHESGNAAIDLVLMDIMMPDMDGIRACRRAKGRESVQKLPIIVAFRRNDTEDLQMTLAA